MTDALKAAAAAVKLDELRDQFKAAGQDHVFEFFDRGVLSEDERMALLVQLNSMDLEYIQNVFQASMAEAAANSANQDLKPPEDFTSLAQCQQEDIAKWEAIGLDAIGRGEVAACVLAGGQGTRLGFDGPKGCYNISLPSGKSLFQLMVERIRRLVFLAKDKGCSGARLPLLVMTSPINDAETKSFFAENSYFGHPADDVLFFQQGTLPCMTTEGKIMLESAGVVATAPDGNGGIYPALQNTGTLAKLKAAGCKYLHCYSVDNSLCRPADPCFVGFCIQRGADIGNKCCWKANPDEKVGVIARKDGAPAVIEYTELDDKNKNLRNESGQLLFGAGNICNHFYTIDCISETIIPKIWRYFHVANKKIPYAGEDGKTVKATSNNGVKMETFIFDVFCLSKTMGLLEASRSEEFAPVKNAPGDKADSPDTARVMVSDLCKAWVVAAGGTIEGDPNELLEISPLVSYAGEGLKEKVEGKTIKVPNYIE